MVLAGSCYETVLSIKNWPDYETVSGSSYTAAYVTGLAATLLAQWPDLTPEDFRQILRHSCKKMGKAGYDTDTGWGVLDTNAALLVAEDFKSAKGIASYQGDGVVSTYYSLVTTPLLIPISLSICPTSDIMWYRIITFLLSYPNL